MCSRFYVDNDINDRLEELFGADSGFTKTGYDKAGDIRPSEEALILSGTGDSCSFEKMKWGFPCRDSKGLIINSRMENIEERPAFANGIKNNRCLIPASGFYEWDEKREKVTFKPKEQGFFLFGGIFDHFNGEKRFTIITCNANASMEPVHDRMPFIIPSDRSDIWFSPDFRDLFSEEMPELKLFREFQQMSLFDMK